MAAERLATVHERAWLYGSDPSLCNARVRQSRRLKPNPITSRSGLRLFPIRSSGPTVEVATRPLGECPQPSAARTVACSITLIRHRTFLNCFGPARRTRSLQSEGPV